MFIQARVMFRCVGKGLFGVNCGGMTHPLGRICGEWKNGGSFSQVSFIALNWFLSSKSQVSKLHVTLQKSRGQCNHKNFCNSFDKPVRKLSLQVTNMLQPYLLMMSLKKSWLISAVNMCRIGLRMMWFSWNVITIIFKIHQQPPFENNYNYTFLVLYGVKP